jgi:hypothetical protein
MFYFIEHLIDMLSDIMELHGMVFDGNENSLLKKIGTHGYRYAQD